MGLAYLSLLFAAQPPVAITTVPAVVKPAPKTTTLAVSDDDVLKAAHLGVEGPALLEFFQKRASSASDPTKLDALIAGIGDKSAEVADRAAGALVNLGANAVPSLRPLANNPDGGAVTIRARRCLELIEGSQAVSLTLTVLHRLTVHKPEGTVDALLGYLPFAEDERVVSEIETSLVGVALRDGKPDPALVRALGDKVPVRRAVAAGVLSQVGGASILPLVRPLLKDPKPTVRLKVALTLVESNEAEAIPVLIDLLSVLPAPQCKQAEQSLMQLAGEWAIATPQGSDATSRRLRREMWHAWWNSTVGTTSLLDEFRNRTLPDADRTAILALIAKLSNADVAVRNQAEANLLALGPKIAPLLRQSVNLGGQDKGAVAKCLQLVDKDAAPLLPHVAPRLLGLRRPAGTLETLLAYLPSAETLELSQQARDVIALVAAEDAQAIPVLVKALQDPSAVRRAAAAQALCKVRDGDHLAAVRKLLADPDPEVRLRVALGLAARREKEAVPILVALLAELPLEQAYDAEDYLTRVAGDTAPSAPLTTDPASRVKTRDAWAAWWKDNAATADLAQVQTGERQLGFLMVVESHDAGRRSGRVLELDRAGRLRWEVTGLLFPVAAQVLPGERVLIAEQNGNRVTERDFSGKVLWEKQVNQAIQVQRLRNGNTFIAGRNHLLELDREGKEILNQPRLNETILAARKLRDGQIAFVTYQGQYVRLDANGKEVKNTHLPFINNGVFGEVLADDHVLISSQATSQVTEYDGDGKVVWQANVPLPATASRLSNGHTLVAAHSHTRLVELDRSGKIVKELKDLSYHPWYATRR